MIKSIEIVKFKRLEGQDFTFSPGVTLIQGPNYSGKTSVLEAICYALYGPRAVAGTSADLGKTSVTLKFTVGTQMYTVARNTSSATLSRGGEKIAESHSAVTDAVSDAVGLTGRQFAALRVSSEGEAKALLMLGGAHLHKLLEVVTGSDQIDQVLNWLKIHGAETEGKLKVWNSKAVGDLEDKATMAEGLKTQLVGQGAQCKDGADRFSASQKAASAAAESLAEAIRNNNISYELDRARRAVKSDLLVADAQVVRLERETRSAITASPTRMAEMEADLVADVAAEKAINDTQAAYDAGKRSVDAAGGMMTDADNRRNMLGLKLEVSGDEGDFRRQIHNTKINITQNTVLLSNDMYECKRLEELLSSSTCPTCGRAYDNTHKIDEGVNLDVIRRLHDKGERVQEIISEQNHALGQLEQFLGNLTQIRARFQSAADEFARHKENYDMAVLNLDTLDHANAVAVANTPKYPSSSLRDQLATARAELQQYERASRALADTRNTVYVLQRKLETMPDEMPIQSLETLSETQRQASVEMEDAHNAVNSLNNSYRHHYDIWMALASEVQHGRETKDSMRKAEGELAVVQRLAKHLRTHRAKFMQVVWDQILLGASSFASECTGGDIEALVQDEGGKFRFLEGGQSRSAEVASAAQKSVLGLGLRLALSDLMTGQCDTLLLDEPTAAADPEVSLAMASSLARTGRQVIIVSHRELDGLAADNIIQLER